MEHRKDKKEKSAERKRDRKKHKKRHHDSDGSSSEGGVQAGGWLRRAPRVARRVGHLRCHGEGARERAAGDMC